MTKHACGRHTDGRTNGQNYDFQDRASIGASRGKKLTTNESRDTDNVYAIYRNKTIYDKYNKCR